MKNLNNNTELMNAIKSNWVIITLYGIYFVILAILMQSSFIGIFIVHCLLMLVALTPIGEMIVRIMYPGSRIQSEYDKGYILANFETVYEQAQRKYPYLSKNVEVYIIEDMYPSAFAVGSNTIYVTRGITMLLNNLELQSVFAHELGHINNWDTKILMMIEISNVLFLGMLLIFKVIFFVGEMAFSILGYSDTILYKSILGVKDLFVSCLVFVFNCIVAFGSRNRERKADLFSFSLGYGIFLESSLKKLAKIDNHEPRNMKERLQADHPNIEERIARLEQMRLASFR